MCTNMTKVNNHTINLQDDSKMAQDPPLYCNPECTHRRPLDDSNDETMCHYNPRAPHHHPRDGRFCTYASQAERNPQRLTTISLTDTRWIPDSEQPPEYQTSIKFIKNKSKNPKIP